MTKTEQELIELIRSHNSPDRALQVAIGIIVNFLTQDESSEAPPFASLQELA